MCQFLHKWQVGGLNVKYVHLDNTGENIVFFNRANNADWKLNLTFEFTGAGVPQRNHLVELAFATLWGQVQAMMQDANIPPEQRYLLYQEVTETKCRYGV